MGMLRNRMLIRLAEWLEWSTYQRAGAVWALTEGIHNALIQRGLSPEQVFLMTNGVNTIKFRPLLKAQARAELGWDDRFTVLYAGNHGLTTAMTTILDAAELMRNHVEIHFVLVGDGVKKSELRAQARRRDLKNVTFLDPMPHDRMPMLLAGTDVCLIPMRKLPLLAGTLPFKMFEVMACARPFVLGAEGIAIARQLAEQEAGAAICVEPENAAALVSAILYLREHPEEAELMGKRGRAFVEARFDRGQLTLALEAQINKLIGKVVETALPQEVTAVSSGFEKGQTYSTEK
jgi:colanic acid biosynthesis glycosyl transferase WcaI